MTLKKLALATALVTAPFMAQAELQSMDDASLSSVTGQAGISISGTFNTSIGSVVYTDTGCGATAADGCSIRMEGITTAGLTITDTAPITVDVAETSIGGTATSQIVIGLPNMTGSLGVNAIKVGGTTAASIGGLAVNDINMAGTQIKVWGH